MRQDPEETSGAGTAIGETAKLPSGNCTLPDSAWVPRFATKPKALHMISSVFDPVLYAEDEEDDVLLVKLAFKRAGIERPLQIARDGQEALDYLLGKGPFSDRATYPLPWMVLLDLNLPQWNGFDVLRRIREEPAFQELPVFVFTSSQQASDMQRARELGANDYFLKTPDVGKLSELLLQLTLRVQGQIPHRASAVRW